MIFPDEADIESAAMYAGNILQRGLQGAIRNGIAVRSDLLWRATAYAGEVEDKERWKQAFWAGDLTAYFFTLWIRDEKLASWEKAADLLSRHKASIRASGSRSAFMAAKSRFYPVLHLWGAYALRRWNIGGDASTDYAVHADFEAFLTEAEVLLEWLDARIITDEKVRMRMWRISPWWKPMPRLPGSRPLGAIGRLDLDHLDDVLFAPVQKKLDT